MTVQVATAAWCPHALPVVSLFVCRNKAVPTDHAGDDGHLTTRPMAACVPMYSRTDRRNGKSRESEIKAE